MKRLFLGALSALALMTAAVGVAEAAPAAKFRLCTGDPAKNYFKAGHILKTNSSAVSIEVVPTKGSLDNVDKTLAGECDGFFGQSDVMLIAADRNARTISAFERSGVLYREELHLLCNRKAGIKGIWDLTAQHKVAIGGGGAGSQVSWEAFVVANKKRYGVVQTDGRDGMRALGAVVDGSQVQCLLSTASLGTSFFKNDAQAVGKQVILARTDDSGLDKVSKDSRGQSVYSYSKIPSGTYPSIQPEGTLYGTDAVGTIAVDALFVTSVSWIEANEQANEKLLRAFNASLPEIRRLVGQK